MKPVRKDGKRQQRRERTLARLEQYLKGGVKQQLLKTEEVGSKFAPDKGLKKVYETVPLQTEDVKRIEKEIEALKRNLGVSISPLIWNGKGYMRNLQSN